MEQYLFDDLDLLEFTMASLFFSRPSRIRLFLNIIIIRRLFDFLKKVT